MAVLGGLAAVAGTDPAVLGALALSTGLGVAGASTGSVFPTGRSALPGYFAVFVGLLYLAAGGGLAWLGYTADASGPGVVAVYLLWAVAAGLGLVGLFLALVGLVAFRQRWIRGPAIVAGGALGVAGGVALVVYRATQGPLTYAYGAAAVALPFAGMFLGWRGGAFIVSSLRPDPGERPEE